MEDGTEWDGKRGLDVFKSSRRGCQGGASSRDYSVVGRGRTWWDGMEGSSFGVPPALLPYAVPTYVLYCESVSVVG